MGLTVVLLWLLPITLLLLIFAGSISSTPAKRLSFAIIALCMWPFALTLAASILGDESAITIGLIGLLAFGILLHFLISHMNWPRGWLAHIPLALAEAAVAIATVIWLVLLGGLGAGGHH